MTQTCTAMSGRRFRISDVERIGTDTVSGNATGYFVVVNSDKYAVSKETYEAVKEAKGFK